MALISRREIPNGLTVLRLVLAAVFFLVLTPMGGDGGIEAWRLWAGVVVFVVAALTDALDGWLARRWDVVSVFGRVMDPFADKVLVLGAFVLLAGPAFVVVGEEGVGVVQRSGVSSWMVVLILARELLVTSLRGVFEGRGVDFSAMLSGKVKMVVQSVGVPMILASMALDFVVVSLVVAWVVVLVTVWSGVGYVMRALAEAGRLGAGGAEEA